MNVWMDHLVRAIADDPQAKETVASLGSKKIRSDLDVATVWIAYERQRLAHQEPVTGRDDIVYWVGPAMGRFLMPTGGLVPLALQISHELVAQFLEAEPPSTQEWRSVFEQHPLVYIDIEIAEPADAVNTVCAIFMMRYDLVAAADGDTLEPTAEMDNVHLMVVLRPAGKPVNLDDHFIIAFPFGNRDTMTTPSGDMGDLDDGWTSRFRAQVEGMAQLALLYHLSHDARREVLPHSSPEALRTFHPTQQRERMKRMSLFKVERLRAPADRFGQADAAGTGKSWDLKTRVRVRGHFKWQAHGPGHSLRKLKWIAAYEKGPADGFIQHALHVQTPLPGPGSTP